MRLEEFTAALGSDPNDPNLDQWRNASLEHRRAADQAKRFEASLARALQTPVDPDLAERIIQRTTGRPRRRAAWVWLAAASAAALAIMTWVSVADLSSVDDPLRVAFVNHLRHYEPAALTSEQAHAFERAETVLAEAGLYPNDEAGAMTYISRCYIGGEEGLHLVLTDSQQRKTTVMFIPEREVSDEDTFVIDGLEARIFASSEGAVAVVAHHGQNLSPLATGFQERGNLLAGF